MNIQLVVPNAFRSTLFFFGKIIQLIGTRNLSHFFSGRKFLDVQN